MTVNNRIEAFNRARGLLTDMDVVLEHMMLQEELTEFLDAKTWEDQVDALCDIIVVATGAMYKMGVDVDDAMSETLYEIESREGSIGANGKWKKDKNQDKDTLYKAVYTRNI